VPLKLTADSHGAIWDTPQAVQIATLESLCVNAVLGWYMTAPRGDLTQGVTRLVIADDAAAMVVYATS
jgi:hypothetical protein